MWWENLNTSKTLSQHVEKVSTTKKSKSLLSRYPRVFIFNKVLIKTLDLDSSKTLLWHVEKTSALSETLSRRVSIPLSLNFQQGLNKESQSWQLKKPSLNVVRKFQHFQKLCLNMSKKSRQLKKPSLNSLNTLKSQFSTRSWSRSSISTVQKPCLNMSRKSQRF
jgi:hypothetical protein